MLVIALVAAALLPPSAAAQDRVDRDDFPQCADIVPEAAAAPLGERIDIHVLVLLDGVSLDRGQAVLAAADAPYAAIGLRLVPRFRQVAFKGVDDRGLIDQAKDLLGGRRPPSAHLVYVLTGKDISVQAPEGEDPGIAGTADCIGGIAVPERAFAVGEDLPHPPADRTPKVSAHELGHLLGAHHHYANCVEGIPTGLPTLSPCMIMMSAAPRFLTLRFSTLSATVVRGYAERFATPLTPPPPPPPQAPRREAQPESLAVTVSRSGGSARKANARRSFRLRLRSSEPISDLRAQVRGGARPRGTYASGTLASLDGEGAIRMRVRRRLEAGRYEVLVTGRDGSGREARKRAPLRFSR